MEKLNTDYMAFVGKFRLREGDWKDIQLITKNHWTGLLNLHYFIFH